MYNDYYTAYMSTYHYYSDGDVQATDMILHVHNIIQALKNMVLYVLLAPYDHEQSDLLHRVHQEKKLEKLPVYL